MDAGDATPTLIDNGTEDRARARKLFPNEGLHNALSIIISADARAIQYLEQAPVIIAGAIHGGPGVRRLNEAYVAYKMAPLCKRGAPLKEVMRAMGLAYPLRHIKASILFPKAAPILIELAKLDPAMLGRIVPKTSGLQRKWLQALAEWRRAFRRRNHDQNTHFAWAAEKIALGKVGSRAVTTVVDFIVAEPHAFNTAWLWPRAEEEAQRWHSRIKVSTMLRGTPFSADSLIDLGKHPDTFEAIGYTFTALRTPAAIADEGAAMGHCVASYITDVIRGGCHIVSVRKHGERIATLELRKTSVAQLKGRFNAAPCSTTTSAAHFYAALLSERAAEA